ncbi:hypothetical protein E3E22_04660 [Thermococcus sp. MV5]|uniref:hypothetical protein n=1 Tax=Thermococcus sp. MV5 TaxID=1638272 RepID=UPI001439BAAB|nr:hypothetical protein [Thermococcus sp. MV5]NJE25922.1 hypothetical protein [Thermococcus sp. MV5]
MRRRGFVLNSAVLILLIPILLLVATYEDVSSQIIQAQSERVQIERSFSSTAYFDIDFQRALEIAGKRAVVAAVDYVSVTGRFLNSTMVNETIRELILFGNSTVFSDSGYNQDIMGNQSLEKWLKLVREKLMEQGFYLLPENDTLIINRTEIVVAPLDSFRVVVKAKIHNITIVDTSGKVVYTGSIPKTTNYTYAIVDIRELEDPLFPPMTGGKYHRSIRACLYPFPELIEKPIIALDGVGESTEKYIVGFYGQDILYNSTHIWKDSSYITNITLNGIPVSPIHSLNDWDRGVLVFKDPQTQPKLSNATAYDIQPFIDCIIDQRYFGVYNGWSLFERLEGSSANHEAYFNLSKQLQEELGLLKNGKYYPIGLLSFLLPDSDWDAKLVNTLNQLGVLLDNQTVVDYYFLQYHFASGSKIEGYKMRGIEGYIDNFYIDNETAIAIFGEQGACDLLEGYTCS